MKHFILLILILVFAIYSIIFITADPEPLHLDEALTSPGLAYEFIHNNISFKDLNNFRIGSENRLYILILSAGFKILGESYITLKIIAVLRSVLLLMFWFLLIDNIFGIKAAVISSVLLIFPPPSFTLWTLINDSRHIENLIFIPVSLFFFFKYVLNKRYLSSLIFMILCIFYIYWTREFLVNFLFIIFLIIRYRKHINFTGIISGLAAGVIISFFLFGQGINQLYNIRFHFTTEPILSRFIKTFSLSYSINLFIDLLKIHLFKSFGLTLFFKICFIFILILSIIFLFINIIMISNKKIKLIFKLHQDDYKKKFFKFFLICYPIIYLIVLSALKFDKYFYTNYPVYYKYRYLAALIPFLCIIIGTGLHRLKPKLYIPVILLIISGNIYSSCISLEYKKGNLLKYPFREYFVTAESILYKINSDNIKDWENRIYKLDKLKLNDFFAGLGWGCVEQDNKKIKLISGIIRKSDNKKSFYYSAGISFSQTRKNENITEFMNKYIEPDYRKVFMKGYKGE